MADGADRSVFELAARLPPNFYQHLNKFLQKQEKWINQATQYARDLDLKLVAANALSNLNQLKISQLNKQLKLKAQQGEEMLYNLQEARSRKNLDERQMMQEVNSTIDHAVQQVRNEIAIEVLKAKTSAAPERLGTPRQDNEQLIFRQLMRLMRGKVLEKYSAYQRKIQERNEIDVLCGTLDSIQKQWQLKIASLQRNSKYTFQNGLLSEQRKLLIGERKLYTDVGYYCSKIVQSLLNHQAVQGPEFYHVYNVLMADRPVAQLNSQ